MEKTNMYLCNKTRKRKNKKDLCFTLLDLLKPKLTAPHEGWIYVFS